MPVLTLVFELKEVTKKNGKPLKDGGCVPVLVRAEHPPGQEKCEGKAYCSPEGWRNPDNGQLYGIQFNPNSSKHWGHLWQQLRNDILECDDSIAGCCRCPDPEK